MASKTGTLAIVLLLLLVFGFFVLPAFGINLLAIGGGGITPFGPTTYNCPDTGKTNVTFNIQNTLDTTTTDTYDETMVCTSSKGHVKTITGTTDDGTDLNCGETYVCKGTSSTGIKGDHANWEKILTGDGSITDGVLTFTPEGASMRIDIASSLHGVVQARLYDNAAAAFCFGRQSGKEGGTAGTWLNGSIYLQSSTNATALAVGSGGNLDLCMDFKIYAHTDEQFMDFYYYVLIDAASNVWDTPAVTVDGITLADTKGSLNTDEAKAYSGYEYSYKVTDKGSKITNNDYARVCININALAGVDPGATNDINVTISSVGAYTKTTDPTVVARGAVKDDSSQTQVFATHVWALDVS